MIESFSYEIGFMGEKIIRVEFKVVFDDSNQSFPIPVEEQNIREILEQLEKLLQMYDKEDNRNE
jgi:hypothetical protein